MIEMVAGIPGRIAERSGSASGFCISGRNTRGRRITTRPVRSVMADIIINRGLWQIAQQIAENN